MEIFRHMIYICITVCHLCFLHPSNHHYPTVSMSFLFQVRILLILRRDSHLRFLWKRRYSVHSSILYLQHGWFSFDLIFSFQFLMTFLSMGFSLSLPGNSSMPIEFDLHQEAVLSRQWDLFCFL